MAAVRLDPTALASGKDMAVERITKSVLFYRLVKLIIIGPFTKSEPKFIHF